MKDISAGQNSGPRFLDDRLRLSMELNCVPDGNPRAHLTVNAYGATDILVELTQQLAWVGSALSVSQDGHQLMYRQPVLSCTKTNDWHYDISFRSTQLQAAENPCWLPLFDGAFIARGFPIANRQGEVGLEIPIGMMAEIVGARSAVEYNDGVVIKGFSSMFIPTKRNDNADPEDRISYQDGIDRCGERLTLQELDLAGLDRTRAVVGWCVREKSILGSSAAKYDKIDYSAARDADRMLRFAGGSLGFQQFGLAQLDFTLGFKDGKCHFQRNGPYQRIISAAEKTPIVLYDTSEMRAWLVPALHVILHIAQHRNWITPCEIDGIPVELATTDRSGMSVKDILLRNASLELCDYENYTFKDMVIGCWTLLEFLIDQNVNRDRVPGTAIHGTLQESIQSYEFKAIVEERSPLRRKQVSINKSCGGWPSLARDIDALVLFANGYEDILRPMEGYLNKCSRWTSVPKWKDYMATSVHTLLDLYGVAGSRQNRKYLTSTQLQWDRGDSSLFELCSSLSQRCYCNRLQRIVPKAIIGKVVYPGDLSNVVGAVIFGQADLGGYNFCSRKRKRESISDHSKEIRPVPTEDEDQDNAPDPSCTDSDQSTRIGSDISGSTLATSISSSQHDEVIFDVDELRLDHEHDLHKQGQYRGAAGHAHGQITNDKMSSWRNCYERVKTAQTALTQACNNNNKS